MSSPKTVCENLFLCGMVGNNAILPWMIPIVAGSLYYFDSPLLGAAVGIGVFLAICIMNIYRTSGEEGMKSFGDSVLCEVPGFLAAAATWMVSDEYLFTNYPSLSALLAGFVGYEAYIQSAERQSWNSTPILKKITFWMFSLTSLAVIWLLWPSPIP